MSDKERVRLLGPGINKVIEVPKGTESVEHEGRLFQRTGFGHSVGPDHPISSFHVVENNEQAGTLRLVQPTKQRADRSALRPVKQSYLYTASYRRLPASSQTHSTAEQRADQSPSWTDVSGQVDLTTTFGPAQVNQANHLPHPRSLPTIIAERGCEQEVQVGLFGKKEVPTTGRMLLSFEPAEFGAVMYTLDQGDSGRSWQVVGTQLLTADDVQKLDQDPNADHQQMINVMIHNALARVRELGIPSLTVGEMRVEIDHPKVGVVGAVRFLDSEWQKKRSEAQDGEKFAPGPNWKSRE